MRECVTAGADTAEAIQVDVEDSSAVQGAMDMVRRRHGRIDVVVYSAGVAGYGRLEEIPPDVFEGVIRTNVFGSANVARSVLPAMRERNRGTLVLVGSVIGHIAVPRMTPYVVSKWAVRGLARQLQLENRDVPGVHICHVAPGGVDTPIYDQGANYAGVAGQPPPSVTPEHVARRLLRRIDNPPPELQVGIGNDVMRFGFSFLPRVYDALVGPVFGLVGRDSTQPRPVADGNVLEPNAEGNALRGSYDNVAQRVGRQVLSRARSLAGSGAGG